MLDLFEGVPENYVSTVGTLLGKFLKLLDKKNEYFEYNFLNIVLKYVIVLLYI